jgi:hypothetical protein
MADKYSYNVKGNQTINLVNIVTGLNEVMSIVQGGGNGGLSDIQIKNINDKLNLLSTNLQNLTTDVDKYIDEDELKLALKEIKDTLNTLVKTNDLTDIVNRLDTTISTINGEISNLKTSTGNVDLTGYVKKTELETKVNELVTDKVKNIENKVVTEANKTVNDKITEKVTELIGNIDTKISDKVTEVITTEKTDILRDVDSKVNGVVKETDLTNKLSKVAKIEEVNTFTKTNNFKDIGTENIVNSNNIKSLSINTDSFNTKVFKYNNDEVIKNETDKFSIGVTDKDINLITKGKLLVNGVEFSQGQDYTLPNTVLHNNIENTLTEKLNGTISNFNSYKINDVDVVTKNTDNDIVLGISNTKTILKGTELYFNNDKIDFSLFAKTTDLSKYADTDIANTFKNNVSVQGSLSVDNSFVFGNKNLFTKNSDNTEITLGTNDRVINIVSKDKLKINGVDFQGNIDTSKFFKIDKENMVAEMPTFVKGITIQNNIKFNNDIILSKGQVKSIEMVSVGNTSLPINIISDGNIYHNGTKLELNKERYTNLTVDNIATLPENTTINNKTVSQLIQETFIEISEDDYNALPTKDNSKIYLIKGQ